MAISVGDQIYLPVRVIQPFDAANTVVEDPLGIRHIVDAMSLLTFGQPVAAQTPTVNSVTATQLAFAAIPARRI